MSFVRPLLLSTVLVLTARPSAAAPWPYHVVGGELQDTHDRWTAGEQGAVVSLDGAVTLRLRPGTAVRVDRRYTKLAVEGTTKASTFVLELESGTMAVENPVTSAARRRGVLVRAPKELAGMSPGGTLVISTSGTRSTIANKSGSLWVGAGSGAWHVLAPGNAWSSSRAVASPYPIVQAPTLDARRHAFDGVNASAAIDGLSWSSLPDAVRYVLQLERQGDASPLHVVTTERTSQPGAFPPVPPGSYSARVTAVDDGGIEGLPSRPVALRVVGVALSPGSYIGSDGAIRVVEREPVELRHTSGLLASYGRAQGWIPAPGVATLFRGEETVIRLRDPRDAEAFDVRLVPRRVAIRVQAGPKKVQWPGEPVAITIDPSDGHGGTLPSSVELCPVVTVGVDRIPVEFKKDGERLRGEVPAPRNGVPGPWVVRVEVADQFGHSLGRDFVEVGVRPPPIKRKGGSEPPPRVTSPVTEGARIAARPVP